MIVEVGKTQITRIVAKDNSFIPNHRRGKSMFEISVETSFSAAHQLRGYQGSCSRLHGHNFRIRVSVLSDQLDEVGIGLDFRKLRAILEASTGRLDHQNLNEVPPFDRINPTSEHIARYLFEELKPKLAEVHVLIRSVQVSESATVAVTYMENYTAETM